MPVASSNWPMRSSSIYSPQLHTFTTGWELVARWFNGVQSAVELPTRLTLGFGTLLLAHVAR